MKMSPCTPSSPGAEAFLLRVESARRTPRRCPLRSDQGAKRSQAAYSYSTRASGCNIRRPMSGKSVRLASAMLRRCERTRESVSALPDQADSRCVGEGRMQRFLDLFPFNQLTAFRRERKQWYQGSSDTQLRCLFAAYVRK